MFYIKFRVSFTIFNYTTNLLTQQTFILTFKNTIMTQKIEILKNYGFSNELISSLKPCYNQETMEYMELDKNYFNSLCKIVEILNTEDSKI